MQIADIGQVLVDEHGRARFAPAQLAHALPFVVFALEVPFADVPPSLQELCVATCTTAGIRGDTTPTQARALLVAHYDKHPLPVGFLARLLRAIGGDVVGAVDPAVATRALLGTGAVQGVLGGGGPRPAGTVAGGALARIALKR